MVNAGTYHMGVNYLHGGSSKDIRLYRHNIDGTGKTPLHDTLEDEGLPPTDGEYMTTDNLGSFELPAGPQLLRFRHLDAGPRFDYFTLTLEEISSTSTSDLSNANALKAYPNPSSNGVFTVDIEGEWSVYSLVGAKVLEGAGSRVDLSTSPRGVYYLRTPTASVKLISE